MRFAERIIQLAQNYARNTRNSPVAYSVVDENCAAWVNSLFKEAGVSASVRLTNGEFSGVDWGEEDTVPARLFR